MVRNRSWDMEIKRVRHHSPEMLPDLYKIVDAGLCAAEVRLTKKTYFHKSGAFLSAFSAAFPDADVGFIVAAYAGPNCASANYASAN